MDFFWWVIMVGFLLGCFFISFFAFHGELVLKCPSCKKRFTFKRTEDPLKLANKKAHDPEVLDDTYDPEKHNTIICQNCGYALSTG